MGEARGSIDAASHRPRRLRSFLIHANVCAAFLLTIGLMGVVAEVRESDAGTIAVATRLEGLSRDVEAVASDSDARFDASLAVGAREREERLAAIAMLDRTMRLDRDAMAASFREALAAEREVSRRSLAELHDELRLLGEEIELRLRASEAERDRFRRFEAEHRDGIVLIHAEFDYTFLEGRREGERKSVNGWGTGFIADREGLVVTNKHVVQPWKFDPELAAMEAAGEIAIDRASLRLRCWSCGEQALTPDGDPNGDAGWDNFAKKTLSIALMAPDDMIVDGSGLGFEVGLHSLGDEDLAILKLAGDDHHPLPLAESGRGALLRKLDPVMALGFPRGQRGLERGVAETSPSIGTIRKVEDTIHVTASIIPGNSGGPLIGRDGRVIGVVTRVYSETLGICIRIERALELLDRARIALAAAQEVEDAGTMRAPKTAAAR